MRMYDLIAKKRDGFELSTSEISAFVTGITDGSIPDYQTAAMMMAIFLKGMNDRETGDLTVAMAYSGDVVDLSTVEGVTVDKHSTGGVGDKTTLIITPIVAACGGKVAKMSGRGLGHTGGTIDRLESIRGFKTVVSRAEFIGLVNRVGACIAGQSGNLAPADKITYALRDVTATVESIPLIAASVMSKKIAAGSECILLDVKVGSGAFMKNLTDGAALTEKMVAIGKHAGRRVVAYITNMSLPIGTTVGNAIEVVEAVEVLCGKGDAKLTELCTLLASEMLAMGGLGNVEHCTGLVNEAISSGKAFEKFCEMVEAQGGDVAQIRDTTKLFAPKFSIDVVAQATGYISEINTENVGVCALMLGAGRKVKDEQIDYQAGIRLYKNVGDFVTAGDVVATFYSSEQTRFSDAIDLWNSAITMSDSEQEKPPILLGKRI